MLCAQAMPASLPSSMAHTVPPRLTRSAMSRLWGWRLARRCLRRFARGVFHAKLRNVRVRVEQELRSEAPPA
jgi:hypothetical protein